MPYTTIKGSAEAEYIEKKSVFTARCWHVDTEEEALARLDEVRRANRDARHNCWAYTIGDRGHIARFSDDGEPSGTGGMPILNAIKNRGLEYTFCVVTRYFGGVLLGAGNLTRAYAGTAGAALDKAARVYMDSAATLQVKVAYPMYGRITGLVAGEGIAESAAEFAEDVTIKLIIREDEKQAFIKAVTDATDGTADISELGSSLYPFEVI